MPDTPVNPLVRWREKALSDPQGMNEIRYPMVRVVEGTNPPEGAELTTDEPHGWLVENA